MNESNKERTVNMQYTEGTLIGSGWPPSLAKATIDDFEYVLELTNKTTIRFGKAEFLGKGWVRILKGEAYDVFEINIPGFETKYIFERGIDVRLSEIVWCADAPSGT